ncbi:hypothetical protein Poli38472_007296 [Pythium oligandrum]|uniref:Heme haloperoxidase family profile domain-containing protein n=1 Tax=Pythium oligandrum TaxID=41045 RepID=A0A8K1C9H0_PYTOL|nr:hypothetical protein Poli38472_007296 [Pythium oligandrum]|eukprot:TMW59151.1 hypothetical protein Poli38472_007296 [Pythium oligandrum]
MVSLYAVAFVAAVLFSSIDGTQGETIATNLPVGKHYRPSGAKVSGRVDATMPYRRSPCPGLNTLANHGYLPRIGQNITRDQVMGAVTKYYNADETAAVKLISPLPEVFDLNQLSVHNQLEHDASLVHADSYLGQDPAEYNRDLVKDVLRRVDKDGILGVPQLGQLRKERLATCMTQNPNCTFGERQTFLAFGESALLLNGFGDIATNTIDKDTLRSFLEFERIPNNVKRPDFMTRDGLLATAAKVQAVAFATPTPSA